MAVDKNSTTQKLIDLDPTIPELEKRDLALTDPYESEKFYTETRGIEGVPKF